MAMISTDVNSKEHVKRALKVLLHLRHLRCNAHRTQVNVNCILDLAAFAPDITVVTGKPRTKSVARLNLILSKNMTELT
jgi:hypothetical protein